MDLSIIMPGLTPQEWTRVCKSVDEAAKKISWEMIIVGPNEPEPELMTRTNIRYVKSLGSPTRCIQEAQTYAQGEYSCHSVEDCSYVPDAFDKCFDIFDSKSRDLKYMLCGKYLEGVSTDKTHLFPKKHRKHRTPGHIPHFLGGFYTASDIRIYGDPAQWKLHYHPVQRGKFIPQDWNVIHLGVFKTEYFRNLGGLDCRFQCQAMAHCDLAVRAQRDGATIGLTDDFFMYIDNTIGMPTVRDAAHGPVVYGQIENDQPLYASIYNSPDSLQRININYNNWKDAPEVWVRRKFGA